MDTLNLSKHFPLALTFDDVLLKPHYSDFPRSDINLSTQLTPRIKLRVPLISAPMDTVTEHELAIALTEAGGLGIIHRNLTIEAQAEEVKKVKAKKLPVGAAVGSQPGYEKRVAALVEAGVDVIVVDSAHGVAKYARWHGAWCDLLDPHYFGYGRTPTDCYSRHCRSRKRH
jgi:IMP dehydrogenase/GMP reductase